MRTCIALLATWRAALALQPLHTPSRRLRQLHVTGSEDDLRDEIARRNAAKADAPRVPTTQPEPTDPLGFASLLWERTLQYGSKLADSLSDEAPAKPTEDIVVLGSGWGAAALVGALGNKGERVTVVSPRNYFLFTPMLAGAAVGTVEYRSITQPVRSLNKHAAYVAVWKSTSEIAYRVDGLKTPRHRADAATGSASRRWRGAPVI